MTRALVVLALAAIGAALATPTGAAEVPSTTTLTSPTPASPSGSGATDGAVFHTGDAQANADTFSLNLKAANATLGFTFGRSIAGYQDRTGSSEARALDLGALPALFGGTQCDGSAPLLNPATLPPLTRADSTDVGSDASRRAEAFLPGLNGGPGGASTGFQDATATPTPSSRAVTESAPADVLLIAIRGGRTETTASLVGQVREAHAVVTADELRVFGGLFTFTKPRWEATARSGDQTTAEGTFSFEQATVLGFPRSAADAMADLAGFKAGLEQLLAPFGVVLDLPQVVVRDDGVKVTPMGFRILDPPIGTDVIVPFLGQIDPLIQSLRKQAVDADCKNELVLTVVDVLLGVIGGSGAIEILVGGVDASTHDVDYSFTPFPEPPPLAPLSEEIPVPVAEVSDVSSYSYDPVDYSSYDDYDTLSPLPFDNSASAPSDVGAVEVALPPSAPTAVRPAATVLPTVSASRFEDSAAGRAGVVVGVVALLGALALSAGDRAMGRRAKRRIP